MKESRAIPRLIRLALFAALAAGLYFLSRSTGSRLALAFAMAFGVLAAESLLVLILDLFKPASHRALTLLTMGRSLLK